ncbi:hypothetical protein LCGC14_1914280 [marine sediment metagenome]|uniref:Uncharacterized protein n=1 Tax=marine sediment metagenome TaxID=412755 RepID=A0A0F9I6Q2_9ZZZZ
MMDARDMAERFLPMTWLVISVLCPVAVGVLVGAFARAWLRGALFVVMVGAVGGVVLVLLGVVNVEPARAVLTHVSKLLPAIVRALRDLVLHSPLGIASAMVGLTAGVLLREGWRHRAVPGH